ncbi:hypothetical protein PINS_up001037 [Pythium insidiosum]|nr:hypothetical protein PINS_up001037 [Pythium insidiosum]
MLWLEQLTISVQAVKRSSSDVRYVLSVKHKTTAAAQWEIARPLAEFRQFQKRLLTALQQGHFCRAECPWLYLFVKNYFPKSSLVTLAARAAVMETRRETLERCLGTLQTFLSNASNHCCLVLTTRVAHEVVSFINGEQGKAFMDTAFPPAPLTTATLHPDSPVMAAGRHSTVVGLHRGRRRARRHRDHGRRRRRVALPDLPQATRPARR